MPVETKTYALIETLLARAAVGVADATAAMGVLADYLQEAGDPLGVALVAALADSSLECIGIEAFACSNDVEGVRRFAVPVFRLVPFARALGLAPSERAADTELVLLPPPGESGTFQMGGAYVGHPSAEAPIATATVRPFLIGRTALSQRVYRAAYGDEIVMSARSYVRRRGYVDAPRWTSPLEPVSWLHQRTAQRVCEVHGLRLPSEVEWEYACRGGTRTRYCFGERVDPDHLHCDTTSPEGLTRTVVPRDRFMAVTEGPSNAYGLHGVHGNVGQWVSECDPSLATRNNMSISPFLSREAGSGAILRGGGPRVPAAQCASASRTTGDRLRWTGDAGLRVVRTPSGQRGTGELARLLAGGDPLARAEAARHLGRLRVVAVIPALCCALSDPDLAVSESAVDALVALGAQAGAALLAVALGSDVDGSHRALEALSRLDPPPAEAIGLFASAMRSGIGAGEGARGLIRLGAAGVTVLLELLSHADPNRRALAAEALAHLRSPASIPALVQCLDDLEGEHDLARVSRAATTALSALLSGRAPLREPGREPLWPRVEAVGRPTAAQRRVATEALLDRIELNDSRYWLGDAITNAAVGAEELVDRAHRAIARRDWAAVGRWLGFLPDPALAEAIVIDLVNRLSTHESLELIGCLPSGSTSQVELRLAVARHPAGAIRRAALAGALAHMQSIAVVQLRAERDMLTRALELAMDDVDVDARVYGAVGLAWLGRASPAIVDGLCDALTRPEPPWLERMCFDALRWSRVGEHCSSRLVQTLAMRLDQRDAIEALGALGAAAGSAGSRLLEELRGCSDPDRVRAIALALGRVGAEAAIDVLEELLAAEHRSTRFAACQSLIRLGASRRCLPAVLEMASEFARWPEQGSDVRVAVELYAPDAAARSALVALFRHDDPIEFPYAVARCVARSGSEGAAALTDVVLAGGWGRAAALHGLSHARRVAPALVPVAQSWLGSEDRDERVVAAEALTITGGGDTSDLTTVLIGGSHWCRGHDASPSIAAALARLGPAAVAAVPRLLEWTQTGWCAEHDFLAAIVAIGPAAWAIARPTVEAWLADDFRQDPSLTRALEHALAHIGRAGAVGETGSRP